jgi:hyperosmotically inducible periplasmic protein
MRALLPLVIVGVVTLQSPAAETQVIVDPPGPAQPGVGERVGETVDRGLSNIGNRLRKTWADFRKSVDELSVQGRVYGRLHWDKAIGSAPIEITVQNENIVTLSGSVPTEAARRAAVSLANDTVGVHQVVDRLTVGATTSTTTTTITTPGSAPAVPPLTVPQQ